VLLPAGPTPDPAECVHAWADYLASLGRPWEIIVIDHGVIGPEAAAVIATQHPSVRIIPLAEASGEGAALRTALPFTRHPMICYTLLDSRFRPADLGLLLRKRLTGERPDRELDHVHLVGAYRAGRPFPAPLRLAGMLWRLFCRVVLSYSPRPLPGSLGWRAHLGRVLVRALFGVRYHDVGCPFRLLRREVFDRLPLQSDGPFVHVEILAKANFLGLVLGEEVPLPSHPPVNEARPGGSPRERVRDFYRVLAHATFGPPGALGPAEEPFPGEKIEAVHPAEGEDPGTPAPAL
jgi:hypothetical protein